MQYQLLVESLGLLSLLLLFLLLLLMLWGIIRGTGRSRNLSLMGFLISLFVIIGWIVVSLSRQGIITGMDWIEWGRYVDFGVRGLWLFLIFMYMALWAFPDHISEKKWILIVALILPLIYEILMFVAFAYYPDFIEMWLALEVITVVIYMAIVPLYATFRYTKQENVRGTPRVLWIWVTFLGVLLWFIGEFVLGISMLFQLPGYDSYFSDLGAIIMSTHTLGWLVMLLGFVFQRRAIQLST
ncbi:MAG: hypothetical protein ACFFEE_10330 [Candidatus Thorarchaeota archaeon]